MIVTENPIDKDKTAEQPGLLPYAHHVGSIAIRPDDMGRVKGKAMAAMYEQTQTQLDQIKEQMKLLAEQAMKLKERVDVSEKIYEAEIGFDPLIGNTYFLYERENGKMVLSMVEPDQWGRGMPFKDFHGAMKLLSDHTWEPVETGT